MDLIEPFSSLRLHNEDDEIINVNEINWSDDETWLTKSQQPKACNLSDFFNTKYDNNSNSGIVNVKVDKISKHIDTRTFTRPKKRSTTNIEESYRIENESTLTNLVENDSIMFESSPSTTMKRNPEYVQFDLTQSITSTYFDKINADGSKNEYLENMSPPSLANSLCSSTFANLMENSFIKNDPILREIRDTDYTQTVLLQDVEPILFQSITDTCNNLDTNNIEHIEDKTIVENLSDLNTTFTKDDDNEPNQTYRKPNNLHNSNHNALLNNKIIKTKEKSYSSENLLDQTTTFEPYREKSPRLLNRRERSPLIIDNHKNNDNNMMNERINQTINNTTTNEIDKKPNSLNCSTDSENIEFMSISSGGSSSKDSYKMLNMDGINAIVEMQERSLQVMSTPIVENNPLLFNINDKGFSPITSGNSNPELSSNNFVELHDINPIIETSPISSTTTIKRTETTTLVRKPKTLSNRLQYTGANIRSSHPNLKMMDDNTRTITTSSNNIKKTNLNTIGRTLKGSYTSLKPISANLPVAPPLDTTIVQSKNVAQTNNQANIIKDETFVRPLPQRTSGLPRPVTGIPRPISSRIPAPKSARSLGKPVGLSGRKQ